MVGPEIQGKENTMSSPAHKIRISNLSATIWRNISDKGTWYSVTPSRSFKQGDETWKKTDSLSFDDLLTMAKLLDQAHTWISRQVQEDATARKARQEASGGE
jgi:predicted esterase